ncbi:MAG: hypothetical protein JWN46_1943 [Acidimicrobiales bacterium]|nr:hypothetical protein [Acidimicrobiales bacterium]
MANEPANRRVVSRRVTKAGASPAPRPAKGAHRARSSTAREQPSSKRYTPPVTRADLPSPAWVPILMFGLLIAGALVIILNYVGALGGVSNVKLVIGLGLILGGIITATQYR